MTENISHFMPTLYGTSKTGKTLFWKVFIVNSTHVYTESGEMDGAVKKSSATVGKIKNQGKKNEVSPELDSIHIMNKKWLKQTDSGYSVSEKYNTSQEIEDYNKHIAKKILSGNSNRGVINDDEDESKNDEDEIIVKAKAKKIIDNSFIFDPMLADTFDPENKNNSKYIDWVKGVFVDPKLDGVRCIAHLKNGNVVLQSRNNKIFNHLLILRKQLEKLLEKYPTLILDGEFYIHDYNSIRSIVDPEKKRDRFAFIQSNVSVGRSEAGEHENYIEYHIFDIFDTNVVNKPQNERNDNLNEVFKTVEKLNLNKLVQIERIKVNSWDQAYLLFENYTRDDCYEGIILRAYDSIYQNSRSKYLKKFKLMYEAEAKIIGFKEGSGKDAGKVIWLVEFNLETLTEVDTSKFKEKIVKFEMRPSDTDEARQEYFKNGEKYIGKMFTFAFQELSNKGIPRFNVGKGIRDYE